MKRVLQNNNKVLLYFLPEKGSLIPSFKVLIRYKRTNRGFLTILTSCWCSFHCLQVICFLLLWLFFFWPSSKDLIFLWLLFILPCNVFAHILCSKIIWDCISSFPLCTGERPKKIFRPKIFLTQNEFQWKRFWRDKTELLLFLRLSKLPSAKVLLKLEFDTEDQVLFLPLNVWREKGSWRLLQY